MEAIDRRNLRSWRALIAFEILGEDGGAAVPDLVQMARGGNERSARAAIHGLAYAGHRALLPLMNMATNMTFRLHMEALMAIGRMNYLGTNARPAVEMLIRSLEDDKLDVGAARVLGYLHLEGDVSVPALERCLESAKPTMRMWGATGLGEFGAVAAAAVPRLVTALNDGDWLVRSEVTNALRRMAPEVLGKMHKENAETLKN